jgi:predicted dinucleotide-binding enzyme
MKIGIIGIGSLTLELAQRASSAGYEILIHHPRGNSFIRQTTESINNARLVSLQEAAIADVIMLFVPREDLEKTIGMLPDMTGKIIVHTSGLIFNPKLLVSSITSALTFQITASLLPKAYVLKLFSPIMLQPQKTSHTTKTEDEIYFAGDHMPSKNIVKTFLKDLGFNPFDLSSRLKSQKTVLLHKKNSLLNIWYQNQYRSN